MTGVEVVSELRANYFEPKGFGVRVGTDAAGFAWTLVRVRRGDTDRRLFGLRFVDYPLSPPTLRFWNLDRWTEGDFAFDFTASGDAGPGLRSAKSGVPTMCIPYHIDYYKDGWHTDIPWSAGSADIHVAELIGDILSRC